MPAGTHIDRSVIGKGVTITHPIRITNTVIMPGVTVTASTDLDSVVMDGEHTVYCPGVAAQAQAASRAPPSRKALRRTSLHDRVVARARHRGRRLYRITSDARAARRKAAASPCSTTCRSAGATRCRTARGSCTATSATTTAVTDALRDVDCVFHLAAQVTIRGSFDRFHEDLDTNVMGTARLLRAVDPEQVKWFTLASSMAVYADADSPAPIDESHPTRPLSPYGVGKLAAEDVSGQVLDGARHSIYRGALLQHLWARADLHAVCRRADNLHHAAAAR